MPINESSVTSTILQKIKEFPAFPPHPLSHSLLLYSQIPSQIALDSSPTPLNILPVCPLALLIGEFS